MTSRISRRTFVKSTAYGTCLLAGPQLLAAEKIDLGPDWPENFFLSDNFAPVHEEVTAERLPVVGNLPRELNGMFLRNGPNPQFPPLGNYHWFDGDGMVHGVRFRGGNASYRNRYVRRDGWKREHDAGKALWKGFADPIDVKDMATKLLSGQSPFKNTANTALVWHHGKLLALWEAGFPHELSLPDLETVGISSFGGALQHAFTANPKIDEKTGEMMVIGYSPVPPFLQYSVLDRAGRVTHTRPIGVERPVFMHDFAITEHYAVLLELPAVFSAFSPLRGGEFVEYKPELGARVGIVPRRGGDNDVRWFEIDTCFVFHVLNAFEEGQKVHLFACRMPKYPKAFGLTATVNADDFGELADESKPVMYRWTFDLQTGNVQEEALDDQPSELPRVNDRLVGHSTKYGYVVTIDSMSSSLLKYDLQKGTSQKHSFGNGRIASETVFAPRSGTSAEDDGWLVTYLYDQATAKSECIVLDAKDVTNLPLARVKLPQRVPYGFHGLWVDGAML